MRRRRADATSANKLVWVAGTIMLVLFIGAMTYAFYGEGGSARMADIDSGSQTLAVVSESLSVAEKDTDSDGVPDWEELLWGTDPTKADSDSDGTPDGQENRLVSASSTESGGGVAPGDFSKNSSSLTETVARELLGAYMLETRNANVDLSEDEQVRLVQQTLQVAAAQSQPPKAREEELSVIASTPEARRRYIVDVVTMVGKLGSRSTNDYALMGQLSGDAGADASNTLKDSASQTKEYAEKIKALDVPEDAINVHVRLVSALLGYAYTVDNIAYLKEDPLRAGVGTQMLLTYDQLLHEAVDAFISYGDTVLGAS